MNNNQEFGLRLNDFHGTHTVEKETTFSDGLVLTIPSTLFYNRGVRAKEGSMDITVEHDDGLICFYGPHKAIALVFEIEELRAIMRLFDVPDNARNNEK